MSDQIPFDHVHSWLWNLGDAEGVNIPPFVLELVLRDGRSFYVRSVPATDTASKTMVVRIWDLRALNDEDRAELQKNVNEIDDSYQPSDLHPKLDQSNLRIPLDTVWYCIEHHDRFWPDSIKAVAGFEKP